MSRSSESGGVEVAIACRHLCLTIVLVHLGHVDAFRMQICAGLLPPDGEVLAEGATEVGAVGSGLRHDFRERGAGTLPVGTLDCDESGEGEGCGQAEDEVLSLSTQDRSH